MTASRSAYILCSAPRSGTTLLCDLLTQTGVAGWPNSFFRQKSFEDWCAEWQVTQPVDLQDAAFTSEYFAAVEHHRRGENGVLGVRVMGPDLDVACDWLGRRHPNAPSGAARFEAAFGPTRFIHLSRQDKVAEAVSYLRAEQTGLWHGRPDGTSLEQIAPSEPNGYDADKITALLQLLSGFDQKWRDWFAAERITPLRLTYEALAEDPIATLRDVLRFIGQDPACADSATPGVRKLADATNRDWIARYRETHLSA